MAPVLGYWDLRGLASTIRNLLYYKEVEFENKLYPIGPAPDYDGSEWLAAKPTLGLDFPNLPYFIDGDVKLSQVILERIISTTSGQSIFSSDTLLEYNDSALLGKKVRFGR